MKSKPFWVKKHKPKNFVTDAKTGERIYFGEIKKPRITGHSAKHCSGGCKADGTTRRHDSSEEADYCNQLRFLKKSGYVLNYEAQRIFYLKDRHGKSYGFHKVDFVVDYRDRGTILTEYKGFRTREWELKVALLSWCYPETIYEVKTVRDLI